MKYSVHYSQRFKKSLKRVKQLRGFKAGRLKTAVTLSGGKRLPPAYKDHHLTGSMRDFRECHLAPAILLIYQIDNDVLVLTLVNVGNHAQLFK